MKRNLKFNPLYNYGPTWIRLAAFSLCHPRECRAGTTILQLISHPTTGPRHFPSDYGPYGLLEQGQRRCISRSHRTVLRDYWPKEAASSRRRAVGTTGHFQGPWAELWRAVGTHYGPTWIYGPTAMPSEGRHSRHSGASTAAIAAGPRHYQ